jgi:hypothetical protein
MGAVFSNSLLFHRLIALGAASSLVFAASPAIGIATASGHFLVEKSEVWGNSTLFDGSVVETAQASSELALRNGVKVQLGAKSRARVFDNRLTLERGAGQVTTAAVPYELDAAGLKITGERVRVSVSDRVEVMALAGSARVVSGSGQMLAAIPAGRSMNFAMQASATGAITRTGCLVYKDGHYLLQDENTREVVELLGNVDFQHNTGNRVEAIGGGSSSRPSLSVATLVMNVTTLNRKSEGGCLSVAASLDAKTEAPVGAAAAAPAAAAKPAPVAAAGGGGGMSTGAKIAIVGAIAGGGAGAALALAGKKSSTSP